MLLLPSIVVLFPMNANDCIYAILPFLCIQFCFAKIVFFQLQTEKGILNINYE